jgi:uroporphyrinogen III methyltransferase/synthase
LSVWLVGAGCGPPGLLTLAAYECLSRADHIVYDRLIHPDLLQLAPEGCRFHLAGKRESRHTLPQSEINELLVRLGRGGGVVVRLKGGDPFVFGRGGEEAKFLEDNGVPWRAVPGITSAIGGALGSGLPITQRENSSSLVLATGHRRAGAGEDRDYWREMASSSGTIALYMGTSNFAAVADELVSHGRSPLTPVSLVKWGGWSKSVRIDGTLEEMASIAKREGLPSPSVIYIGGAAEVKLSPEKGMLDGIQVVLCRPYPECWNMGRELEKMSADSYGLPLLSLEPICPNDEDTEAVESADWLVITSPRGAERLKRIVRDLRRVRGKVVSIGRGTSSALLDIGIAADIEAGGHSLSLAETLETAVSPGDSVVFARNERGAEIAVAAAKRRGALVKVVPIYRMTPCEVPGMEIMREQWEARGVDAIVFGSSAMAGAYFDAAGHPPKSAALVAWGGECGAAIRKVFGIDPVTMETPDMAGLVSALRKINKRVRGAGGYGGAHDLSLN